jgi:hypothetical protein
MAKMRRRYARSVWHLFATAHDELETPSPDRKPTRRPAIVTHPKLAMATHPGTEDVVLGTIDSEVQTLQRDGIVAHKGAFTRDFIEQMREDMMTAFWEAIQHPGCAVSRGSRRWYVVAMCERVLGQEYKIVEVGFDTPFQGAEVQPWHRDFPSPPESYIEHRITSLAFNLTGVDVTPDMGPFEIAPGTQWDDSRTWNHQMFPDKELWPRFEERGVRKSPQTGDVSCRSALTVHRGTPHVSPIARPVLVIGVDAPELVTRSCTT